MKDTFIMNKKVFHNETSNSNSLASPQPEREFTLKTPTPYFEPCSWRLLKKFSQFFSAGYHYYIQKCYHKWFDTNIKSFYILLHQFDISNLKNGSNLGPEKSNTFLKHFLLTNATTYEISIHIILKSTKCSFIRPVIDIKNITQFCCSCFCLAQFLDIFSDLPKNVFTKGVKSLMLKSSTFQVMDNTGYLYFIS